MIYFIEVLIYSFYDFEEYMVDLNSFKNNSYSWMIRFFIMWWFNIYLFSSFLLQIVN
jgi:hypothetical protein